MQEVTPEVTPEVMIIYDGTKARLVGDYVRVKHGQELSFTAVGTQAIVFLPLPDWFEDSVTENGNASNTPGHMRKTEKGIAFAVGQGISKVKVKATGKLGPRAAAPVIYRYAIYCAENNDFVECNSSPIMIIEPPPTKKFGTGNGTIDEVP
ncbi:MAG: hypothetical protein V1694_13045 [Candidatus Eisenbacteria bacterium]